MKEALLYKKLKNQIVQCHVCNHYCVLKSGARGHCGVRLNANGKLYNLTYGKLIALNIDPVEKKPLFHFMPGTQALSLATIGCNFQCQNCQNADISQATKQDQEITGEEWPAQKIIEMALKKNITSIAYTYTEPTIFLEYALEIMKLAHQNKLKNIWVSNGYFSKETFGLIRPYLDAINIDLKFFNDKIYQDVCGARLEPILKNLKQVYKNKIHLEVATLLIPGYTDKGPQLRNIAKFIKNKLSNSVPWHISRFYPAYKMINIEPTTPNTIDTAYEIGKSIGLKYVYVGNVVNDVRENTICPNCGKSNIVRSGHQIKRLDKCGHCYNCNYDLSIFK
ncbi:MAG: AmmeMemoRadiSam system radical SAM enzyme [Patescibacteria group bacterium]|nr:AmmeMemoRadiSam system radical SAM enzyme [Patescibacteria group bacterium]MDD5121542.1 AmmeMemoRadiSam system radical SAM enzyme [Patescibacteria group bacterium]MDD5222303.1 AmmeMemoRadiSam system radical SAM enzyme [Patescibacteria group bacterium]MDD5396294.1 AmmeMemoRadiSam system radical SAM enzyme [Patescibacteria group bacterium]